MKKFFKRFLCMMAFAMLTVVCARADSSVIAVKLAEETRLEVSRVIRRNEPLEFRVPYGRRAVRGRFDLFDEGRRFAVLVLENNTLNLECGHTLRVVTDKKSLTLGQIDAVANIPGTRASSPVATPASASASASDPASVADASMDDDAAMDSVDDSPMTPPSVVHSSQALPNLPPAEHGVRSINVTDEYGRVIRVDVAPGTNVQEVMRAFGANARRHSI